MSRFDGFGSVQLKEPQRSTFDHSHKRRISTRMGRLTPVLIKECIPGDVWRGSTEMLVRLAPLLAPIYDEIIVFVHFFFVPNRPMWEDWEEFITGGRLGVGIDPLTAPLPPTTDIGLLMAAFPGQYFSESTLADYLGVPILPMTGDVASNYEGIEIDLLPFMAYQWVRYEYYRDRNFIQDSEFEFPYPSGAMDTADAAKFFVVRYRDYLKEYFTSALPFVQRGQDVLMPLSGTGTVTYLPFSQITNADGSAPLDASVVESNTDGAPLGVGTLRLNPGGADIRVMNIDEVQLTASSVTINDFRTAYALQVWLERNAVAGSRYTESLQAHFHVRPQDSRLQRPEFIGGGRIPVRISEVVSTAYATDQSDATIPQGNMAGHGITYGDTNQFKYFVPEHGFIIGICSIMAPPSYHQGLPKMFRRRSFLDYPWPTFAKLGEQPVQNAEIFASAANLTPDENGEYSIFGYQSQYAEWKYTPDTNHGDFHTSLLFWTLTRTFEASPILNESFTVFDDSTQDRIFAVVGGNNDNFWLYVNNRLTVNRCLPYFGTPNTLNF